jgi:hypothetical protein
LKQMMVATDKKVPFAEKYIPWSIGTLKQ